MHNIVSDFLSLTLPVLIEELADTRFFFFFESKV